jgi:hypothetical protein
LTLEKLYQALAKGHFLAACGQKHPDTRKWFLTWSKQICDSIQGGFCFACPNGGLEKCNCHKRDRRFTMDTKAILEVFRDKCERIF